MLIWAAAAAVVLAGGVLVLTQQGKSHITSSTGVATGAPGSSASASTAPPSTVPPSTALPPTTSVSKTEPAISVTLPVAVAATPQEQAVLDYLTALAERRYDDAALLLGQGGLELEARADLRPLFDPSGALPSLADGLKEWCESPAMCQLPTNLTTADNRVVATFAIDGVERSTVFVGATFEGAPLVQGLPLRLPPVGASIADTVECPTSNIVDTAFADLDGDGWPETITLVHDIADGPNGPPSLHVCGTTLVVRPFTFTGPSPGAAAPSQVFALDIEDDGKFELMVADFDPDAFHGGMLTLAGDRFGDTAQRVTLSSLAGASFGCVDGDGDGTRDLVSFTYEYVGGSDLSNSTSMSYVGTILLPGGQPGATVTGTFELPAQEKIAFDLIAGYCGALPVQTG